MATKREQLEKLVHDMQTLADAADVKGDFTSEDRQKLIDMMADSKRLSDEIKAEAEISGGLTEAKNFLATLAGPPAGEKKSSGPELTVAGLPMDPPKGKTFGELFTQSEPYQDFIKRYGGRDGIIPTSTKGIQSSPFHAEYKDLITGSSATSAGAAVRNDLYAPITDLVGDRELMVADLVTRGQTDSDTVEYVRVTAKTNAAAPVVEASAASGTSGTKPESAVALAVVSTTVKTIAHWIPITKRAASDAGQVRTLVDNFLRYGVLEELEDQILNGDGTGENFAGIIPNVGNTVGSAGTDIDAVVAGIQAIRLDRRRPNAAVFHPNDWYSASFLLAKDSQGRYLIGDPRATLEQLNSIWGLTVVVSEAMPENTVLVGEFRQAVLWEREGITLSMSDSHSDFFVRNLLAILAEGRWAFGILDPDAFCTVTSV